MPSPSTWRALITALRAGGWVDGARRLNVKLRAAGYEPEMPLTFSDAGIELRATSGLGVLGVRDARDGTLIATAGSISRRGTVTGHAHYQRPPRTGRKQNPADVKRTPVNFSDRNVVDFTRAYGDSWRDDVRRVAIAECQRRLVEVSGG